MRLAWRADSIDTWRKEVDGRLDTLESRVGSLTRTDEIAEAVAQKLNESQTVKLTEGEIRLNRWQVRSIVVGIPLAIATGILAPIVSHLT